VSCWLARSTSALLLLVVLFACDAAPTRERVLRSLIATQLVPNTQALAKEAAKLTESLRALSTDPESLSAAKSAWRSSLLAWERVYAFRLGPLVANSGLLRARFWPAREAALAVRLADAAPPSESAIDQLGVDVRGMYALEWLLFSKTTPGLSDAGEGGARVRALAVAFAHNAQGYVERASAELGDGSALANTLGERAQDTVSQLVNQMVGTVETLASDRLATVLEMHAHQDVQESEVQGARSGVSTALVIAQLTATEALYVGHQGDGLAALVRPVAPTIDERVRSRFTAARQAVERLGAPLTRAVTADRAAVLTAFRALKELELALKVDLASALGVTLTFSAGDGD
jgi:predicted lipoprotein